MRRIETTEIRHSVGEKQGYKDLCSVDERRDSKDPISVGERRDHKDPRSRDEKARLQISSHSG